VSFTHPSPFRARKGLQTFPRISIRNGFTRPTGDINVNSPVFTKRPSSEEILTENLCDLPFFFRGPVHSRFSTTVKGGSDPTKLLGGFTAKKWGRSHPI
jgi:hypothetical protein